MLTISAKVRKELGKKVKELRKKGILPGVLYGPKTNPVSIQVDLKEFEKVYEGAGETSLVSLEVEGKKYLVLIYDVELDPLTERPIHVDFYQPNLEKKVEATVPLVFKGEAPAVKELGGTLVKNIPELEVKAKPQDLPHEIMVDISCLKTFDDEILVKDLPIPEGVEVLKNSEEVVALVSPPEKVDEELEKPIEEKVEEVEKVEEKKQKEQEE